MSNRQMEERAEQRQGKILAEELGITVDELDQMNYSAELETSNDGVPYYYRVEFGDGCPQAILDKVDGLEGGRSVRLDANLFDAEEHEEDYE